MLTYADCDMADMRARIRRGLCRVRVCSANSNGSNALCWNYSAYVAQT